LLAGLLLAAALLAGCKDTAETAATPSVDDGLPKQAQPKLPTLKLYLGAETLDAEMALTPQQEQAGMMFRTNIAETDAMIFVFAQPTRASFWMKNCPESISAAYIGPDGVIAEIHHLEKNDTKAVVAASDNITSIPGPSSAPKKAHWPRHFCRDDFGRRGGVGAFHCGEPAAYRPPAQNLPLLSKGGPWP
jgi:uncharacterized membrane protein (UPF0127 family)